MIPTRILIVDDEQRICDTLRSLIELHYSSARVIGSATNIMDAENIIRREHPDIVLLDIKMPGGTGFDLLDKFETINFKTIFLTAFDEYAVKAFKYSASDYLLKPVIAEDLVRALGKATEAFNAENENKRLKTLLDNLNKKEKKIILNTQQATYILDIKNIVRLEADRNYTRFYPMDQKPILVSGSLKEYEDMLKEEDFIRPHHSHLVNSTFISKFDKKHGGLLALKDGTLVPVSVRKQPDIAELIKKLK
jgi:two-component system LytT family response regulator